jgi:hypothetical protein
MKDPKIIMRFVRRKYRKRYSTDALKEQHICKNCGHEFYGSFCNLCGQQAYVKRFEDKSIFRDMFTYFFKTDSSFFYSIQALIVRPGAFMMGYLKGKRVGRMHPFQLLFILAAIYAMLIYIFFPVDNVKMSVLAKLVSQISTELPSASHLDFSSKEALVSSFLGSSIFVRTSVRLLFFFANNIAITNIIFMPVYAYFTKRIFKKSLSANYDFNFTELILVRAYLTSIFIFFSILLLPFFDRKSDGSTIIIFFFSFFFTIWCYCQLFGETKWRTLWKVIKIYTYLLPTMIVTILLLVFIVLFFIFL